MSIPNGLVTSVCALRRRRAAFQAASVANDSVLRGLLRSGAFAALFCALLVLLLAPASALANNAGVHYVGTARVVNTGSYTLRAPEGVLPDKAGNLYISDFGNNKLFKVAADGTVTDLTSYFSSVGGISRPEGMAMDSAGNLYLADNTNECCETFNGNSSHTYHRILILAPGATTATVMNITGQVIYGPVELAISGSTLFIANYQAGDVLSVPLAGGAATEYNVSPQSIAADSSGNVYTTAYPSNTIYELTTGGSSFSALSTTPYAGLLPSGLNRPWGIDFNAAGTMYIADSGNNRVVSLTSSGILASVLSTGSLTLGTPSALKVDASGNIFIADTLNARIVEVSPGALNFGTVAVGSTSSTATLNFTVGNGVTVGSIDVLSQGAKTVLNGQKEFADAGGSTCTATTYGSSTNCSVNISFSPQYPGMRTGAVVFRDSSGNALSAAYMYGTATGPQVAFSNAPQTNLNVQQPGASATDAKGDFFVVSTNSMPGFPPNYFPTIINTVYEYPWNGSSFGMGIDVADQGTTGDSGFSPVGLAVDGAGNLFISDQGNSTVMEVPFKGSGGYGTPVQIAGTPTVSTPFGIAVDGARNLYVADYGNDVVLKFPWNGGSFGSPVTIANRTTIPGLAPEFVAVDASGNVYIGDPGNQKVEKLPWNGSSYGTPTVVLSGQSNLGGLVVDAAGDVYVSSLSSQKGITVVPWTGTAYGTPTTLATNLSYVNQLSMDATGDLFTSIGEQFQVTAVELPTPGAVTFKTSTNVGSTDITDGPATIAVSNIGNASLSFITPSTGSNPSYPANFPSNSSDSALCASASPLAAGGSCDVSLNFIPSGAGSNSGSVVLTDNNLNAASPAYTTQSIAGSGTGLQPGDATAIVTTSASNTLVNSQSQTLTAKVSDSTTPASIPVGQVTFTDTYGTTTNSIGPIAVDGTGKASTTYTPAVGSHTVTSVFTPTDSSQFSSSSDTTGTSFTVAAYGALASFSVTAKTSPIYVGVADPLTITALDALGNVVANYGGSVTLTSSDTGASFSPASPVTMISGVSAPVSATFATTGSQTVTAAAGNVSGISTASAQTGTATNSNQAVTGTSNSIVVNPDPGFVVTVLTDDATGIAANCTDQNAPGATPDANCSLRDALASAAAVETSFPGVPVKVTFLKSLASVSSPGTVTLASAAGPNTPTPPSSSSLAMPSNTTLKGLTSGTGLALVNLITVDGNNATNVFSVATGVTNAEIDNLTIAHGIDYPACKCGAGVYSNGGVTLNSVTITGNSATNGGGIYNNSASVMTILNSAIASNAATGGTNHVGQGGGIYNAGALTVKNTTIAANTAGGSTFASGGGLYTDYGSVTLINATISGNTLTSTTSNQAAGLLISGTTVSIQNSIVSGNTDAGASPGEDDCYGTGCPIFGINGNVIASAAAVGLAPLGNYGGPTQTMLPYPGSVAICLGVAGLTGDQRGQARPSIYGTTSCTDSGAAQTLFTLKFAQQPTDALVAAVIAPSPTVQLSESGSPVALAGVRVSVSASAGILSGTASHTTDSSGLSTFSGLSIGSPQSADTLTASASLSGSPAVQATPQAAPLGGYITPTLNLTATSNTFNILSPLTAFTITAYPTTTPAGPSITYTVTAYNGTNVATGYTGTAAFTTSDSKGGFFTSSYAFVTGDLGVHAFTTNAYFHTVGNQTITVTDQAANVTATSNNILVTAGTPAIIKATGGGGQSATIGAAFTSPLGVLVTDYYGNPESGITVNYAAPSTGASAALSSSGTVVTASDGTASLNATANATAGAYTVTATSPSVKATVGTGGAVPMAATPESAPTVSAKFALTNTQATPTVTLTPSPASPIVYGSAQTSLGVAVAYTTGTPTGTASFTDSSSSLGSAVTLDSNGAGTFPAQYYLAGTHSFQAGYGGDANYNTANSTTSTYIVNKASSTLTGPTTQPVFVVYNTSGSIPVSIPGQFSGVGITPPTGSVSYGIYLGSTLVSTDVLQMRSGSVSVPVANTLAPGIYNVSVAYSGDSNYNAATTINVSLQVGQIQPTLNWTPPAPIVYGTSLNGILNAAAVNNTTSVPGTYAYTATPSGGSPSAVTSASVLPAGSYTLSVLFTPTDTQTYKTATATVPLTITKATPTVRLTSSLNPSLTTNPITLTATISSAVSTPTGTVTFYYGSTALGSAVTLSNGVATLVTTTLPIGTDSLTAVYSGDPNFLTGTSSALAQVIEDFNLTISTSSGSVTSVTVVPGATATYLLVVGPAAPATTFPSIINLTATGLPAGATYTLTPSSLPAGSGATSVTLVINTAATAAANHGAPPENHLARGLMPLSLALLLIPFTRRMRRAGKRMSRMLGMLLLVVAGMAAAAGLSACGSSSTGFFGQASKTYTILVTGTSGPLTHSTSVTLTIE